MVGREIAYPAAHAMLLCMGWSAFDRPPAIRAGRSEREASFGCSSSVAIV
jgi:hypothetical protein